MQELAVTRRVRVVGVEPEDVALRAELFRTLAGYGAIEEVYFEEDRAFHSGAAVVQFQRLSSAERLRADVADARGGGGRRGWGLEFLPPAVRVGPTLLLTSPRPLDPALLPPSIRPPPEVTLEERLLTVPAALGGETAATEVHMEADGKGNKSQRAKAEYLKALACVRSRCIGKFAIVMEFPAVHDANNFLITHQLTLASTMDLYLVHVGPDEELRHALKEVLLLRRSVKDVTKGSILRGIVLPQNQGGNNMTSCEVDAGITRKGRSILLRTQTNFVKVLPWDLVDVRITSSTLDEQDKYLEAELRSVVGADKNAAEFHKSSLLLNRLRQGTSSSSTPAPSSKALAGRLYQALQERKAMSNFAGEQQGQQSGAAIERVHGFPKGIHTFSVVSVCVQRIGDDGIYARTMTSQHVTTNVSLQEWPVFVPSLFVPHESGMSWRDFAVPGERMTVTVLYATSVGGSEAALKLVASKREAEMRRASALSLATGVSSSLLLPSLDASGENNGLDTSEPHLQQLVHVGTAFSGSRAVWLPNTPSSEEPVFLLLPSSSSLPALFTLPVFLRATHPTGAQIPETMTVDAGLHPFVISEVVQNDYRGRYAMAVEEATYRQMEAERLAVQQKQELEQDELVRRIVADISGEGSKHERKRMRSP
ncbi:uncharacterized protein TM35_000421640 [Trypanosoma theileri]|uniref:RNA-binding protein n=1 Tax=Trypanosoma theileri TaxID=67003 RepID=A0A1X0NJ48_9TRYP|nr:uncharacterized protein TM35_000421640 [Trypanosoma theileri]ORC84706.1 hypothetical protein TM35_000421640 [Trypanosoma theileri]